MDKTVTVSMRNPDGSGETARHGRLREDLAQGFFNTASSILADAEAAEAQAQKDEAAQEEPAE